ncbi:MAG: hypothetical protein C0510_07500 [Erythrobacter sp.]|nr:hypothetical protein [Erythrobacter sp.]
MTPGTYLEKRRLMAGYSLSSLARELLMLTCFGTSRAESDFRRLRLTLISAEQGSLHHSPARIETIRNFVPLDPAVYFRLVDGEQVHGLCRLCACSFHDPCVLPVGPAAALGTSVCDSTGPSVCSACEQSLARLTPERSTTVAQQLRELGEEMRRLAFREDVRTAVQGVEALETTLGQPPFLRLVPTTGEN